MTLLRQTLSLILSTLFFLLLVYVAGVVVGRMKRAEYDPMSTPWYA